MRVELEKFIKKHNIEDIINAAIIMSSDTDIILTDVNITAAEWIVSNVICYDQYESNEKFDLYAYNEMKQISSTLYEPIFQEIFGEVIKHKEASDEIKKNLLTSILMKLKNAALRGDAYQFQLMEMSEKLYKPFDSEFMEALGFTFSTWEKIFVYIYKKYIVILFGTDIDSVKIDKIQKHSFRVLKRELYQLFQKDEVDSIITYLSIKPGDKNLKPVERNDFKILYSKPLIDFGEYIYFPLPVTTLLNFPKLFHYSFIAEKIFTKDVVNKYTENRGDVIEELTKEYLLRLFDKVYLSLKYPAETKEFEADITVQSENTTILAEAKGKILTLASLKGNLSVIKDDVYKAIGKAYEQSVRTISHIEKNGKFIKENDDIDEEIYLFNTPWKFPMCIMAENFASIPSEIYNYVDIKEGKLIPYAVNIYDLDIITRECISKEEFINYLIFRQINIKKLTSMDELDLFGYFKENGLVEIKLEADEVWPMYYTEYFDKKYYDLTVKWFEDFDFR